MLATVIGLGSMGCRRASILKGLGIEVEGIDPNVELTWIPPTDKPSGDVVFVCTPPDVREEPLRMALEHGRPMLIEKPLAAPGVLSDETLDELRKYPCRVSENLLYSLETAQFFKTARRARCLVIYGYFSHDLSRWRPKTDYKQSYNARNTYSLVFDCHEINVLCNYFGRPIGVESMFFQKGKGMEAFRALQAVIGWRDTSCLLTLGYNGGYTRGWHTMVGEHVHAISLASAGIEPTYLKETSDFLFDAEIAGGLKLQDWALDAMDVHRAVIQSHEEKKWISLS
mgnify:CR=1 FL=1